MPAELSLKYCASRLFLIGFGFLVFCGYVSSQLNSSNSTSSQFEAIEQSARDAAEAGR